MPKLRSSSTMSGTLELRRSGTFSLKVRPRTPTLRGAQGNGGGDHQLDRLLGDEATHAVVDAATGQDDLRLVADLLGLRGEVVRVHADAVPTDQPGRETQEVPFGARRRQHLAGRDAEPLEDHRQFVHQRDVDVALGVLDDLGGLRDPDRTRAVDAGIDDRTIGGRDPLEGWLVLAGDDLDDRLEPVLAVVRD